jgi:hypothetical protein
MLSKVIRPHLHEPDQPTLGRGVRLSTCDIGAGASETGTGTGDHDGASAAAFDEGGDRRLHGVPHADEVHVDDVAEDLARIRTVGKPDNSCVRHDDVQAAVLIDALAEDAVDGVGVTNVGLTGNDSTALVLY